MGGGGFATLNPPRISGGERGGRGGLVRRGTATGGGI